MAVTKKVMAVTFFGYIYNLLLVSIFKKVTAVTKSVMAVTKKVTAVTKSVMAVTFYYLKS